MADLVDFPRGGEVSKSELPKVSQKRKRPAENVHLEGDLFGKKPRSLQQKKPAKGGKKTKLGKKSVKVKAALEDILPLTRKVLVKDALVLVGVKAVQDHQVIVNLPASGCLGEFSITAVSRPYTHLLQAYAQSEAEELPEDLSPLSELFSPGDVLPCKVLGNEEGVKGKLKLSAQPSDVNSSMDPSALKKGVVIWGAVKSVEDHGYTVDLGIPRVEAFLHFTNATGQLRVGAVVQTAVLSATEGRVVTLTTKRGFLETHEAGASKKIPFKNLIPGSHVTGIVTQVLPSGMRVKILSLEGSLLWADVPEPKSDFTVNQAVECRVLHVNPFTKVVSLTRRGHVMTLDPTSFPGLDRGQILEATVTKVSFKAPAGADLMNDSGVHLFANKNQITDDTDDTIAALRKLAVNSKVRCRILAFDYLEAKVLVSLKKEVLNREYMDVGDMVHGSFCHAKFRKFHKGGATVILDGNIRGFIPTMHLSDIPLKHPEAKFTEGDKMVCRVLKCDTAKRQLMLTCKSSLLKKNLTLVGALEDVVIGSIITGFIVALREKGILVAFFNDVTGWVPKSELSHERIEYPEKVFYMGQVVKCKALAVDPANKRLRLSFKLDDVARPFGSKKKRVPDDFKVGAESPCTVAERTDAGLEVTLQTSGMKAFLPSAHLTDHPRLVNLLAEAVSREGHLIERCAFSAHGAVVMVTSKPSYASAAREGQTLLAFEQVKAGSVFPGFVKKIVPYGVFVDFGGQLVGLVPTKYITDARTCGPAANPDQIPFTVGQSVKAAVVEVDTEKKRFIASLRRMDCYQGDRAEGLDLMQSYFDDCRTITDHWATLTGEKLALTKCSIGYIKEAEVTASNDDGMTLALDGGVKGFVTFAHTANCHARAGDKVQALVLNVDPVHSCVECTVNPKLVKAVRGSSLGKPSEARPGQVIKGEVIHVDSVFILVCLRGHATGKIALVPAKEHINELSYAPSGKFSVGQVHPLIIQDRMISGFPVGWVETEKDRVTKTKAKLSSKLKPVGTLVSATITKIHDLQLNVKLAGGQAGRVYITQVADDLADGERPLAKYTLNQTIQVVITGYRVKKSNLYLPAKAEEVVEGQSVMVECSLKPSHIGQPAQVSDTWDTIKPCVGDHVTGFVFKVDKKSLGVQLSPLEKGTVPWWSCSTDNKVLSSLPDHFKVGEAYKLQVMQKAGQDYFKLSITGEEGKVKGGQSCKALITGRSLSAGVYVSLTNGLSGKVALGECLDESGDSVRVTEEESLVTGLVKDCHVYSCDSPQNCQVSFRSLASRTKSPCTIKSLGHLTPGQSVIGYVTSASSVGVFLSIGAGVSARVTPDLASTYEVTDWAQAFPCGRRVKAKVTSVAIESNRATCSMLPDDTGSADCVPKALRGKKVDRKAVSASPKKRPEQDNGDGPAKKKAKLSEDTTNEPADKEMDESEAFDWGCSMEQLKMTPEGSSADGDKNGSVSIGNPTKKRLSEKAVYQREHELADAERAPDTAEDFERLVFSSPDSSLVWLQYIAMMVEKGAVEEARALAQRALQLISPREEQERMNVWRALFTLELLHGSDQTLEGAIKEAAQRADPLLVHQTVASVYENQGSTEKAEQAHMTVLKKWGKEPSHWVDCARFYYTSSMAAEARKLLDRCLKTLHTSAHVDTIAKFAHLEYKEGDRERGKTMFENVLDHCPRRTDLWSQYVDLLVKSGDIAHARAMFQRVIKGDFSMKKMRLYFKKYAEFEEKHGDAQSMQEVKLQAAQYLHMV